MEQLLRFLHTHEAAAGAAAPALLLFCSFVRMIRGLHVPSIHIRTYTCTAEREKKKCGEILPMPMILRDGRYGQSEGNVKQGC